MLNSAARSPIMRRMSSGRWSGFPVGLVVSLLATAACPGGEDDSPSGQPDAAVAADVALASTPDRAAIDASSPSVDTPAPGSIAPVSCMYADKDNPNKAELRV